MKEVFVVYNDCEGEFSLSHAALMWLSDRGNVRAYRLIKEFESAFGDEQTLMTIDETMIGLDRHNALLVLCVEQLGTHKVSGKRSSLRVKRIVSDKYIIRNTGGIETVLTPDDIIWIEVN